MKREVNYSSEEFKSRAEEVIINLTDEVNVAEEVVEDLIDTLKSIENRNYLCANEIGRKERIAVVKFEDEYKEFINPVFQEVKASKMVRELDPTDNKQYIIPRFIDCTVCYQLKNGEVVANKLTEQASVVFGQLMDCLNGIHDSDYGLEIIPEFDEASEEEQLEVVKMYAESIQELGNTIDKDLKDVWTNIKYNAAVAAGDVEFEKEEAPKLNRSQRRLINKLSKKLGGKKHD